MVCGVKALAKVEQESRSYDRRDVPLDVAVTSDSLPCRYTPLQPVSRHKTVAGRKKRGKKETILRGIHLNLFTVKTFIAAVSSEPENYLELRKKKLNRSNVPRKARLEGCFFLIYYSLT